MQQTETATKQPPPAKVRKRQLSQNFWALVWRRFKKSRVSMFGLGVLGFLVLVAALYPFIVGTKPIVTKYKGSYYFPALGYYHEPWEHNVFDQDKFRNEYPSNLLKHDKESWAIWPLVYQDPYRKVREQHWRSIGAEFERQDEIAAIQAETEARKAGRVQQRQLPAEAVPEGLAAGEEPPKDPAKEIEARVAALDEAGLQARLAELQAADPGWKHQPSGRFRNRQGSVNNSPPTGVNYFGTDALGRDVFARIVHGTPIALLVGFVSMGIATFLGLLIGGTAGLLGGWVDTMLSRLMEVVSSVPSLIFILALIAIIPKPTIWHTMAVIGLFGWVGIARLVRGEFLKLRNMEFAVAAAAIGASRARVMVRHLMPNALAPVLVSVSFGIAGAILTESGLSFLGFGVQPPTPSWGSVLRDGFQDLTQWWLILFPGIAVFLAVFTYNLVGDGLQEAMDPRLKR